MTSVSGYTNTIAEYIASIRFEDIPDGVIERAKYLLLDGIGCGIYGSTLPWTQIMLRTLSAVEPEANGACIWNSDVRLSIPHAALINATAIHAFELDDMHFPSNVHCASPTIPAALALAEYRALVSGPDLIASVVAGFEVAGRVGACMRGRHMLTRGWQPGAIVGSFAASATAARLLSLSAAQCADALGIAGSGAGGLLAAEDGAMVTRTQHGRACQSGVYAALLASEGLSGTENVFELPTGGFCSTFTQSPDAFDLAALVEGLGAAYETLNVRVKFYPCRAGCHAPVHTALSLRAEHEFSYEEIERIVITGDQAFVEHGGWKFKARNVTEAQMNLGYCVAAALVDGDLEIARFDEGAIRDPVVLQLAEKIDVEIAPRTPSEKENEAQIGGESISVRLHDGRVVQSELLPMKGVGSKSDQFPYVETVEKFRYLVLPILGEDRTRALESLVLGADELRDVRRLLKLMSDSFEAA